jgi:hypothetical protein
MPDPVYTKISQTTEKTYIDLAGTETFPYITGTSNYRVSAANIAKYILGVVGGALRVIGANVAGAVVTTTDTQEMTNKNLIEPKVGGIKLLATVTGTIINYLNGAKSNIQDQINALVSSISGVSSSVSSLSDSFDADKMDIVRTYSLVIVSGPSGIAEIKEDDILATTNCPSGSVIDQESISATVCHVTGSSGSYLYEVMDVVAVLKLSWISTLNGAVEHLKTVILSSMSDGETYSIALSFKIKPST